MELDSVMSFLDHEFNEGRLPRHPCTRQLISDEDLKIIYECCGYNEVARVANAEKGLTTELEFVNHYTRTEAFSAAFCKCDRFQILLCLFLLSLFAAVIFFGLVLPSVQ